LSTRLFSSLGSLGWPSANFCSCHLLRVEILVFRATAPFEPFDFHCRCTSGDNFRYRDKRTYFLGSTVSFRCRLIVVGALVYGAAILLLFGRRWVMSLVRG
jgi:hypothetical protein